MKVGVQTRPWGPEMNRQNLRQVLADVVSAGYDGIEIGAQHLDVGKPEPFRELLAEYGLSPAAIHVGGEIWNPDSVKEALANLERAVAFAAAVGAPYLAFSGAMRENKSEQELANTAQNLERIGRLCRAMGLTLAYHNHYWEIAGDCRELRFICENTDPELVSLCLDVAWVQRGGGDPAQVATEFLARVGYFHLKDTTESDWKELGAGEVDFDALMPVVLARASKWVVVEQDVTGGRAVESARTSRNYLKERWGI